MQEWRHGTLTPSLKKAQLEDELGFSLFDSFCCRSLLLISITDLPPQRSPALASSSDRPRSNAPRFPDFHIPSETRDCSMRHRPRFPMPAAYSFPEECRAG